MAKKTKAEIIQELQDRNISFDGGASEKELSSLLAESVARDSEVNAPGATADEDEGHPVVQPLESVEVKVPVLKGERCWNCYAQNRRTRNTLDKEGVCADCGFEKGLLYNGNIEAEKAKERALAAQGF